MALKGKPEAEVAINSSLVRALLKEQHADLADLALTLVGEGWDNVLFRLGDDLVVRLPRRALSAALIEHEQHWLPQLADRLPLPIPAPVRTGRAGHGYPWSWSITPWFHGQSALLTSIEDLSGAATVLRRFLHALHQPAHANAPHNPWRSGTLLERTDLLHEHLKRVGGLVDRGDVLNLWERVLRARQWPGPLVWIHGDLHPGNLIVKDGRLSAVVDFGDLTAGDPATDCSVAWMLWPATARAAFRAAIVGEFDAIDDDTWMRARGWALKLGLAFLANSANDENMRMLGLRAVNALLNQHSDEAKNGVE